MSESYRDSFRDAEKVRAYEYDEYAPRSYPSLIWELQKKRLLEVADRLTTAVGPVKYLDFACGSGRVLSFLAERVSESVGVDVSAEMISAARRNVRKSTLLQGDITTEPVLADCKFDLVTAFRFILNAEPALRLSAMQELASRLASPASVLVFTNHGNLLSHKLLLAPLHLSRRGRQYGSRQGNYLTHLQVKLLVQRAGLRIENVYGYGLYSARALDVLSYGRLLKWEAKAANTPGLHRLGCDRLYVTRLASRPETKP
jgi:SAM-dependent methyltransferase